jgi:arginine decarboxylase
VSVKSTTQRAAGAPGNWSLEDSLDLYQIPAWGKGYFGVNPAGHLVVRPDTTPEREIDLHEVVQGLSERDLRRPWSSASPTSSPTG